MDISGINSSVELNNGVKMPWLGLGVWAMSDGKEVEDSVLHALEVGYRSIDTASIYQNERGVGRAIAKSNIERKEVFITSKVWNSEQGYDETLKAFERSLKKLNLDYLDLYLVHWPVTGKYVDSWKALEKLYDQKLVRAIGVSNFNINHLEDLLSTASIAPAINQIEYHPHLTQPDLLNYCNDRMIQVEAWSPIMQGKIAKVPEIVRLSKQYKKTPAQIVLRWDLQNRVITIPKSSNKQRIIENSQIFDFELKAEDIELLNSLNKNFRYGPNPEKF